MKVLWGLIAATAFASPCFAQGFTGGELRVESNQFDQNPSSDALHIAASAQYGLTNRFSTAVDLSFSSTSQDTVGATVHGIFAVSEFASVGLFYAGSANDTQLVGVEGAIGVMGGMLTVSAGELKDDTGTSTTLGIETESPWAGSSVSIFTDFDIFIDGSDVRSTNEIGVAYGFDGGFDVFAQYGLREHTDGITSSSDSYIGLGGRMTFGPDGATTFGSRN